MSKDVYFYYDYGSPTAYLAWTQLPELCERHQANLHYKPVLLGGIFKATGNSTPVLIAPKGKWLFKDIERYAVRYGVPYQMNPHFVINSMTMMRGAMWAQNTGVLESYNKAMYEATWVNGLNMSEPDVIASVMNEADLDAAAMLQAVADDSIKKQLIEATGDAVEQGVFGAPTMIINGELHFGQDRLDWVERQLAAN